MIARRYQRIIIICIFFWVIYYFFYDLPAIPSDALLKDGISRAKDLTDFATGSEEDLVKDGFKPEEKELVVASMRGDNTSWLDQWFGDWKKNIYVVNDPTAPLTVQRNKGREAMPFLTYIYLDLAYETLCESRVLARLTFFKLHNRPLRNFTKRLDIHPQLALPVAQRRSNVRRRASSQEAPFEARSGPGLCCAPMFLDNGLPLRIASHQPFFRV